MLINFLGILAGAIAMTSTGVILATNENDRNTEKDKASKKYIVRRRSGRTVYSLNSKYKRRRRKGTVKLH